MKKSKIFIWFCFCLILAVFIDSFFTGIYIRRLYQIPAESKQYINQEIVFQAKIIKEPDNRIDKINLVVRHKQLGQVLVAAELGSQYQYGDLLKIKGKLLVPKEYEDFNYREYLAKDRIYFVSYYPDIELLDYGQGNFFYAQILKFKNRLRQVIDATLLPPQTSILKAVFLGDKQSLSDDLKEELNITGTRHIVAISGMHMIIWTQILMYLCLAAGLWRKQAFYFVLILLFLYILMIGFPASAVRAGIMAGLLLLAQQAGRLRSADRAVVFAAAIMLMLNPLLLKSDVGFQLSFAAVLSIIYLKPLIDKLCKSLPNPFKLKDILTLTLAAQIGVLPLLILHFGRLSLISPIANLLIVPFLPALMISGLVLTFTGLIWLGLAKIIAWLVWLLLTFIVKIIEYLSQIPLASYSIQSFSWVYLIGYYLVLVIVIKKFGAGK